MIQSINERTKRSTYMRLT